MKYYCETDYARTKPINVRFCRDCPLFKKDGFQPYWPLVRGWCVRLSDDDPMEGQYPHYVHVTSNSFCNEDEIEVAKTFSEASNK